MELSEMKTSASSLRARTYRSTDPATRGMSAVDCHVKEGFLDDSK